jgi:hypothetical protein
MSSRWTRSPQDVDPLSWFAGPRIPILLSIVAVAQGLVTTIFYWNDWSSVALQFVAMPFFLIAGWLTASSTDPRRARLTWGRVALILLIGFVGLLLAAGGTVNSTMPIQQWWPGIALAVTLTSFAPYSSARSMILYAIPTVAATAIVGVIVFSSLGDFWPTAGIIVIATGPLLVAAVASTVFCYSVVARTEKLLGGRMFEATPEAPTDDLSEAERTGNIARLSARVGPFLERIEQTGVITQADRALAAQIARGLRDELVTTTSKSWLDVVAAESGVAVSDPARLAASMNESQRTALRALIVAATENSVVDKKTVLVELRAQADGSTAVALSIDVDLPEGRRMMLLAPYYLTLQTTVDDLSWADGRSLLLKFRIPPRQLPE